MQIGGEVCAGQRDGVGRYNRFIVDAGEKRSLIVWRDELAEGFVYLLGGYIVSMFCHCIDGLKLLPVIPDCMFKMKMRSKEAFPH